MTTESINLTKSLSIYHPRLDLITSFKKLISVMKAENISASSQNFEELETALNLLEKAEMDIESIEINLNKKKQLTKLHKNSLFKSYKVLLECLRSHAQINETNPRPLRDFGH